MGFKDRAENRWASRVAAQTAPPTATVRASAQVAIPRPAGLVWEVVERPESSVLLLDNITAAFWLPGTPVGEVGAVQCDILRTGTDGRVGVLHEVVELDPGRRAVSKSLSMELQHWGETEVIPTDTNGCVLRVTLTMTAALGTEEEARAEAQRGVDQYVTRVHNLLASGYEPPHAGAASAAPVS